MSTSKDIEFHLGETWQLRFTMKNADGSILPLPTSGMDAVQVFFRLSSTAPLITKTIGDGIDITDEDAGAGMITIIPEDQTDAPVAHNKSYKYELKVITPEFVSVQCIGSLKVLPSLFEV